MSATLDELRSFTFSLPEGCVPVPVQNAECTEDRLAMLGSDLAAIFDLPTDDPNAAAVAGHLAQFGATAGAEGVDYAAVGIYRSPDRPDEPVMVLVSALAVPSNHERPEVAIDGLLELHQRTDQRDAFRMELPTGPAVAVVTQEAQELVLGEHNRIPLLRRQVTAWAPDLSGSTLAVISVSTNNWRDWQYICGMAIDIFRTLEWAGSGHPALPEETTVR